MANLQATLLRFRNYVMGAQGDISNMFYMVRATKEEEMMQLFVWKCMGEKKLRAFCTTRLVMGKKTSNNISMWQYKSQLSWTVLKKVNHKHVRC